MNKKLELRLKEYCKVNNLKENYLVDRVLKAYLDDKDLLSFIKNYNKNDTKIDSLEKLDLVFEKFLKELTDERGGNEDDKKHYLESFYDVKINNNGDLNNNIFKRMSKEIKTLTPDKDFDYIEFSSKYNFEVYLYFIEDYIKKNVSVKDFDSSMFNWFFWLICDLTDEIKKLDDNKIDIEKEFPTEYHYMLWEILFSYKHFISDDFFSSKHNNRYNTNIKIIAGTMKTTISNLCDIFNKPNYHSLHSFKSNGIDYDDTYNDGYLSDIFYQIANLDKEYREEFYDKTNSDYNKIKDRNILDKAFDFCKVEHAFSSGWENLDEVKTEYIDKL